MEMNLNIGFGKDEKFVSTSLPMLKPWGIYEVQFDGCEYSTFDGKKDPTATFEVLKFKFKNDEGQFTETLFAPKPGDEKRGTRKNTNGHEIPTPSNLESFKFKLGQLLTFICPEALTKMSGKSLSFKDICNFLQKITDPCKGKTVAIKLVGTNKGDARFPYFLNYSEKTQEMFISNNFISDNINKLALSTYELSQKETIANAKPTDMNSIDSTVPSLDNPDTLSDDDASDLDLDLL